MVDSINGIGQSQNVTQTNKSQEQRAERAEERVRAREADQVEISQEAIDLAEAEQAAREARDVLARDESQTLGLDPSFDEDAA